LIVQSSCSFFDIELEKKKTQDDDGGGEDAMEPFLIAIEGW
jgi:hypothetical protein